MAVNGLPPDPNLNQVIYKAVAELRLLAAAGLKFTDTHHDTERYTRVRNAAVQLAAAVERLPEATIAERFAGDIFEQSVSPILTVDAAILRDRQILLIKRHDNGLWAMPGGMVEVNQTLAEATLRELQEETGIVGTIQSLMGIFDSQRWGSQSKLHMQHVVFLVDGGEQRPRPTPEALDVDFFAADALPFLSPGHHLRVPHVLALLNNPTLIPYFDPMYSAGFARESPTHTK